MDIQLPGMDGLELTRVLRLDSLQAVTPVIALTAYTDPGDSYADVPCDSHDLLAGSGTTF
jgi:CheY-like chemotaxis protein